MCIRDRLSRWRDESAGERQHRAGRIAQRRLLRVAIRGRHDRAELLAALGDESLQGVLDLVDAEVAEPMRWCAARGSTLGKGNDPDRVCPERASEKVRVERTRAIDVLRAELVATESRWRHGAYE